MNSVSSTNALNPQLAQYVASFTRAREKIDHLTAGLDQQTFNQPPPSGGWSIAEVIDHLCILGEMLLPRIDVAIDEARVRGWHSTGPFRYPFFSKLFVKAVGPISPNKRGKVKAPKIYVPTQNHDMTSLIDRFKALQDRLICQCNESNGRDLRKPSISSPVSPLIRVRLGAWFEALAAHQTRHFQQIERIREELAANAVAGPAVL